MRRTLDNSDLVNDSSNSLLRSQRRRTNSNQANPENPSSRTTVGEIQQANANIQNDRSQEVTSNIDETTGITQQTSLQSGSAKTNQVSKSLPKRDQVSKALDLFEKKHCTNEAQKERIALEELLESSLRAAETSSETMPNILKEFQSEKLKNTTKEPEKF